MKYKCVLRPLTEIILDFRGPCCSLCDKCMTSDCSNVIVYKDVTLFGVTQKRKVYLKSNNLYLVLQCEGFIPCTDIQDE